jgi:hypothetical protein
LKSWKLRTFGRVFWQDGPNLSRIPICEKLLMIQSGLRPSLPGNKNHEPETWAWLLLLDLQIQKVSHSVWTFWVLRYVWKWCIPPNGQFNMNTYDSPMDWDLIIVIFWFKGWTIIMC